MDEIIKLKKFNELKKVYRFCSVENRKESSAEHSWSSLMLADYFLNLTKQKIDRLKVYEILMYHDVIEIETGDIPIHHEEKRKNKKENEIKALNKLKEEIPKNLKQKFVDLFNEYQEQKTIESNFAKAVDKMDALIHELDNKSDWKGWNEKMVRGYHEKYIKEFPAMHKVFEKIIKYVKEHGYFNQ